MVAHVASHAYAVSVPSTSLEVDTTDLDGLAVDDQMLLVVHAESSGFPVPVPDGWDLIATLDRIWAARRRATTEDVTGEAYTITAAPVVGMNAAALLFACRGGRHTDVALAAATPGTVTVVPAPAVVVRRPGGLLYTAWTMVASAGGGTWTPAAGMVELEDAVPGVLLRAALAVDDDVELGTTGARSGTCTVAANDGTAFGVSIHVPPLDTDSVYVPEPLVEVAFGYGPYDDPPVDGWVEVGSDVFEATTQRGRGSEFDQFNAGTATVSLNNDARTYDPLHGDGPYAGALVPDVPVRIRAATPTGTHDVWRGFVDGWPAGYSEGGFRSEVAVACTDAFKILAQRLLPPSVYDVEVLADEPHVYWPLGESQSSVVTDRGPARADGAANPAIGSSDALRFEAGGAATFQGVAGELIIMPARSAVDALPVTVEAWISATSTLGALAVQAGAFSIVVDVQSGLQVSIGYGVDDARIYGTSTEEPYTALADGRPHHLVVTIDAGGASTVTIDGVAAALVSSSSTSGVGGPAVLLVGGAPGGFSPWDGRISDLAVYPAVLDAGRVAAHYTAGTRPWDGDTTGQRIGRVLDLIGWPAELRALDQGETILGPALLAGQSALSYLQAVAATEQGRLFIDAAGRVAFHDRARLGLTDTLRYTFTDVVHDTLLTRPDAGIRDESLSITVDDQFVFDAAVVTRDGGVAQTVAAVANPVRARDVSGLLFRDDQQARALADWIVFRYRDPQPRVDTWDVDPEVRPQDWDLILGLGIGDRVAHSVTPGAIGDPVVLDLLVEEVAHSIGIEQWVLSFHGVPTDPNDYLLWGNGDVLDVEHGWYDAGPPETGGVWG